MHRPFKRIIGPATPRPWTPKNIECIVKSTDAVVKGQTAASSYKPATLDNGLKIMVPPFIESGEKIILDSRNMEYVKKIN